MTRGPSCPVPALVIAYSPCVAQGCDMRCSLDHAKLAVETGFWPLFRFDPRRLRALAGNPD